MPLSWNEIKSRALAFSKEWEHETSEDAEGKSFWDGFFNVFGITRKRVASFEEPVKKLADKQGYIDLFWKGVLIVEHKSRGKSLDKAHEQALDYFPGINERDLPRYILVSDFARFRLYDLEEDKQTEFDICNFHKNVHLFSFIAGYQTHRFVDQDPVNIHAAEKMGVLHDQLKNIGYSGHQLELYLVRLLFCLFAEDTGIYQRQQFQIYIEERTSPDGSDLGNHLSIMFQTLNTEESKRQKSLDEQLAAFPFINGRLFEELLPTACFDASMRQTLLDCCALDWSKISPAVFGSLFQSIMDKDARRNLGAHYTSEKNILKLIKPLFLDDLWEEFNKIKKNRSTSRANKLREFHQRLQSLTFLDPACGCGNFLVIAYRELRILELEILKALRDSGQMTLDIGSLVKVNVSQFYGIEIKEFPVQIARVALWLMDHQMNLLVSESFGMYFARIPLITSSSILCENALRIDWASPVGDNAVSFVLGNPPFVGHQWRNQEQVADMAIIWGSAGRFGRLDYVSCWYKKATDFMRQHPNVRSAFVSTNSITQGEQVGIMWPSLFKESIHFDFAHRTFKWSSEARGKATVHCVIIGFSLVQNIRKTIFDYEQVDSDPHAVEASNINAYLVDAPNVFLPSRNDPPPGLLQLKKGSQPTDGGHLILTEEEKTKLVAAEPGANKYIKPYIGGEELINGGCRWCLWLKDAEPAELRRMPLVMQRIKAVAESRKESPTKSVQDFANYPTLFTQDRQPNSAYLAVPEVSSENRHYVPIGFLSPDIIGSNKLQIIEGGTLYNFAILSSTMHNAWIRAVAGRLESRYSYAPAVYNNFPWPKDLTKKQLHNMMNAAQLILDCRAKFTTSTLADLYDPQSMPPDLLKAHHHLDVLVDAAYGRKSFRSEAERVAFLFDLFLDNNKPAK